MDSRTIYVGHREPPPGTEAYIPQRFPDNRIVSSKVVVFSFIYINQPKVFFVCSFISFKIFPMLPVYFSFMMTSKGVMKISEVSTTRNNCQIVCNMNRNRMTNPLFTVVHGKVLE